MLKEKQNLMNNSLSTVFSFLKKSKFLYALPLLLVIFSSISMFWGGSGRPENHRRNLIFNDFTDNLNWRNALYQVAWGLILLAWIQCNSFLFRLMLISGEICFIVWAWVYPNIELDTVIWNGVFIFINLIHMIISLIKMKKVLLTPKEKEIYAQDFWMYFHIKDFKALMKFAEFQIIQAPKIIFRESEIISDFYY